MPALPTLTVPQAQLDRIVAAFGTGVPQTEAVARYKEWLRLCVIDYVTNYELKQLKDIQASDLEIKRREIRDALPPPEIPLP